MLQWREGRLFQKEKKMLVTFSCQAYANVTFFGDVGQALLKMMGYSPSASGSIPADAVPTVLEHLKSKVATTKESSATAQQNSDTDFNDESISLATRALPLLELLKVAAEEKCNVWWKMEGR